MKKILVTGGSGYIGVERNDGNAWCRAQGDGWRRGSGEERDEVKVKVRNGSRVATFAEVPSFAKAPEGEMAAEEHVERVGGLTQRNLSH